VGGTYIYRKALKGLLLPSLSLYRPRCDIMDKSVRPQLLSPIVIFCLVFTNNVGSLVRYEQTCRP